MTTTPTHPWGDGPAPGLDCGDCGRRIGKDATHNVLRDLTPPRVLCDKCFPWGAINVEPQHATCYPDCPYPGWHETEPHWVVPASRGIAWCWASGVELPEVPVTLPAIFRGPWPLGPDAPPHHLRLLPGGKTEDT